MPKAPTAADKAVNRTREWREARKRAGFVKMEIWAPAACRQDILSAVRAIVVDSTRGPALAGSAQTPKGTRLMDQVIDTAWTIPALKKELEASALLREGELTATVIEGADPVLLVTMHEYGDLPIYVSAGPMQIIVSVVLWPVAEQENTAEFNIFLLKTQKLVPLSSFGITTIDGQDYYELLGEISAKTSLQTIVIELRTLAENAIDAASDLRDSFRVAQSA
ncbi:MAG: YjfI family protein [Caulobacter sp.]|nr:YjfI family protein [Caulobacter sp.]